MRVIIARYEVQSDFRIPKNIPLLSNEDNDGAGEKVWSWWIKWNTLHYIDDKGEVQTIEPYSDARDDDLKRPSFGEEDEEQETDDEEEEHYIDDCDEDNCKKCRRGIYCDCNAARCPHCN